MKFSSSVILYCFAGLAVVGLIVFAVVKDKTKIVDPTFAQCLTDHNVKMYGTWWCPHCVQEKEMFGTSFVKINYIECSDPGIKETNQKCKDANVESFPTWEFSDGSRESGLLTFEQLTNKTGCPSPIQK